MVLGQLQYALLILRVLPTLVKYFDLVVFRTAGNWFSFRSTSCFCDQLLLPTPGLQLISRFHQFVFSSTLFLSSLPVILIIIVHLRFILFLYTVHFTPHIGLLFHIFLSPSCIFEPFGGRLWIFPLL